MTEELVPMIQTQRVGAQEPAHPRHQAAIGSLHQEMKMIAHEAVRMHLEIRFLTGFSQGLEEVLAVHIIGEDVLPAITTTHDVLDGTGVFDAELTRHRSKIPRRRHPVKSLL